MRADHSIAIVLALVLVHRAQPFPTVDSVSVRYSHPRVTRDSQDMESMQNQSAQLSREEAGMTVLRGVETIRRFVKEQTDPNNTRPYSDNIKIINIMTALISASHLLDSYRDNNSTKLTVLSVIVEEVALDICQWLGSTFNTTLNCTTQEEIIYDICQWLSTINDGLQCENREEFLATFVTLSLDSTLLKLDRNSRQLFMVSTSLDATKEWIESSESVLEHQDYICNFLFPVRSENPANDPICHCTSGPPCN